MIDCNRETLLTLSEAAKLLPARRAGKKTHISCLYRWTKTGCRGVVLESLQVGGTRCTSKEALARFFREHPVPSGERALRQSLERFDWYRGFRRDAARELEAWLDSQPASLTTPRSEGAQIRAPA